MGKDYLNDFFFPRKLCNNLLHVEAVYFNFSQLSVCLLLPDNNWVFKSCLIFACKKMCKQIVSLFICHVFESANVIQPMNTLEPRYVNCIC